MATDTTSLFDTLPQTILTTSILPYVSSDEWLQFRVVSSSCYYAVHGTRLPSAPLDHTPDEEVENLWNFALVNEFRFQIGKDNLRQTIYSQEGQTATRNSADEEGPPFLSTKDVFMAQSSFISWKHWRKLDVRRGFRSRCANPCRQTVAPYYLRAAAMWKLVEDWCNDKNVPGISPSDEIQENSPAYLRMQIKRSLKPGIDLTSCDLFDFEEDDVITALTAIYSFYCGQTPQRSRTSTVSPGLFGGYSAYDSVCMMGWLNWMGFGWSTERYEGNFIVAIDSMKDLHCAIVLEIKSGLLLYVNQQTREAVRALPDQQRPEESLLKWFEEYTRRLSAGYYSIGPLDQHYGALSLLHYPSVTQTTACSRAVTRGIEVCIMHDLIRYLLYSLSNSHVHFFCARW